MERKPVIDEAIIQKAAEEMLEELRKGHEKSKELISSTDYILWLEKFTFSHPTFCDDEWRYFPEQVEPENLENVELLSRFFEGVEMYVESKDKELDEFGYSILIRFNNVGYKIGVQSGQGTYYYCERCEIFHNESDFFDFNEIMKKAQ